MRSIMHVVGFSSLHHTCVAVAPDKLQTAVEIFTEVLGSWHEIPVPLPDGGRAVQGLTPGTPRIQLVEASEEEYSLVGIPHLSLAVSDPEASGLALADVLREEGYEVLMQKAPGVFRMLIPGILSCPVEFIQMKG